MKQVNSNKKKRKIKQEINNKKCAHQHEPNMSNIKITKV